MGCGSTLPIEWPQSKRRCLRRALLDQRANDKCRIMCEYPTNSTIQHLADKHKVIVYLRRLWKECFLGPLLWNEYPSVEIRAGQAQIREHFAES
jgi:hypothetical protein